MASYNIKRPCSPVPIERMATVTREAASRYWSMFRRYFGEDQFKWFDVDLALSESADLLDRCATLSKVAGGDDYVRDLLDRAIAKHTSSEAA